MDLSSLDSAAMGMRRFPSSLETCILMVNLMDRPPYNGKLNLDEFRQLLKTLKIWEVGSVVETIWVGA